MTWRKQAEERVRQTDRAAVCAIISDMLDNPDEHGIYPTSVCYSKLVEYCDKIREEEASAMFETMSSDYLTEMTRNVRD